MFTGDAPVILNEQVHGVGQGDNLRVSLDLDPLAEERVGENAQRSAWAAPQVLCLDRGLTGTDQHPALVVHRARHGGQLRHAIGSRGGQDCPVMGTQEVGGPPGVHVSNCKAGCACAARTRARWRWRSHG